MERKEDWKDIISNGEKKYIPHLSVDCVLFGFHDNQLKVLLLKPKQRQQWALPGGFVLRGEAIENAANRVLLERTGIADIFLKQFHVFSDPKRIDTSFTLREFDDLGLKVEAGNWLAQRFITIGFYALITTVDPSVDVLSDDEQWWDIKDVGDLILDHNQILDTALTSLRAQLNFQPIGYKLLPEKFTFPELVKLYETILNKKLDSRNFRRKLDTFDILIQHEEKKAGVRHRAPYYYSFDQEKYQLALLNGMNDKW
jgi:8-oxo-dGTP diphosphatase